MNSLLDRTAGTVWKFCLAVGLVGVGLLAFSPPAVGSLSLVGFVGVLALGASLGAGAVVAYLYVDARVDADISTADDAGATGEGSPAASRDDSSVPKSYDPARAGDEDESAAD